MSATDEDQTLREQAREQAESAGWTLREVDRVDIFTRGETRIRVIWRGNTAISGGALYQDDILMTYTRDLDAVTGWLKR